MTQHRKKQRAWAQDAAVARCDLNVLYAVIAILEGGTVSAKVNATAERIIKACKSESAKCLTRYDHALAQIGEYE